MPDSPEFANRVLLPAAAVFWMLAVLLTTTFVSWWLTLVVLVVLVLLTPRGVRAVQRRQRLGEARHGVVAAAWQELRATAHDKGSPVDPLVSVREAAGRLAEAHEFDEDTRAQLRQVVDAFERAWYAPEHRDSASVYEPLVRVVEVLDAREAPSLLRRWWPASLLRSAQASTKGALSADPAS